MNEFSNKNPCPASCAREGGKSKAGSLSCFAPRRESPGMSGTVSESATKGRALRQRERWCERRDSNSHGLPHWNLNPARLPVPPLSLGRHKDRAYSTQVTPVGGNKTRRKSGVDEGARTLDRRSHNPELYQLSYVHHIENCLAAFSTFSKILQALLNRWSRNRPDRRLHGTPGRIRTCDPRLRRPLLYPAELRALDRSPT